MTGSVSGATRVAGVIGHPIEHTRSPAIWNAAFEAVGLDWVFVAFPVPPGRAADALTAARVLGLGGLSVTMPHKSDAAVACDELSPASRNLRAVNAVWIRDGRIVGDSTDGAGFLGAVRERGFDPEGINAVVLGAGGAGRAVAHALGECRADVTVVARRKDAAQDAATLAPGGRAATFDEIERTLARADMVVNATPVGMQGEPPPFDVSALGERTVVVDTVYEPLETPLLAAARERGLPTVEGLGMLVHQAAVAFVLFTGTEAPIDVMRAAAARA